MMTHRNWIDEADDAESERRVELGSLISIVVLIWTALIVAVGVGLPL